MLKSALLPVLLLSVSPTVAQTSPPTAAAQAGTPTGPRTYGAGHLSCSSWVAAETKPDQSDYYANRFWVAGFMSAYNWYVAKDAFDIGLGLAPADMKTFMHAECAAHPTETIATAASAMLAMLKTRQGK